jgi:hypothetical protein
MNTDLKAIFQVMLGSVLVALVGAVVIGCKTAEKPASASFASVRIRDHTREQIRAATAVVFQQDGYNAVDVRHAEMVFEKPAGRWERMAHGHFVDEAPITVRVRVTVVPVSSGVFDVRCQAFTVRHKGDAAFEEEVRLKNNRSEPYQALLDRVPGRLSQ